MKSLWQISIYLFAGIGATGVFGGAIWFGTALYHDAHRPAPGVAREPVIEWHQPDSFGKLSVPYTLAIFGTADAPPQVVYIGSQPAHHLYGKFYDLDISRFASLDGSTFKGFLERSVVEWTDEGVRIVFPSGHMFFVPRTAFPNR